MFVFFNLFICSLGTERHLNVSFFKTLCFIRKNRKTFYFRCKLKITTLKGTACCLLLAAAAVFLFRKCKKKDPVLFLYLKTSCTSIHQGSSNAAGFFILMGKYCRWEQELQWHEGSLRWSTANVNCRYQKKNELAFQAAESTCRGSAMWFTQQFLPRWLISLTQAFFCNFMLFSFFPSKSLCFSITVGLTWPGATGLDTVSNIFH